VLVALSPSGAALRVLLLNNQWSLLERLTMKPLAA